MSSTTKNKHVTAEVRDSLDVLPADGEFIVRLRPDAPPSKGNNLHEVQHPDPNVANFLASMPSKFRRRVWVKRGDFVVVAPIPEGDKVKAEIVRVLYKDQIRHIKAEGLWPERFRDNDEDDKKAPKDNDASDSDDDLFKNTNRPTTNYAESETSSSSQEEEDDE